MRRFIQSTVIIVSTLFIVVGCGNNETGVGSAAPTSTEQAEAPPADAEFIYLKVDGMTWKFNCVPAVQSALEKVDGVKNAKVVLEGGKASVTVEKGKVDAKQLEQAVASIQGGRYKAKAQ